MLIGQWVIPGEGTTTAKTLKWECTEHMEGKAQRGQMYGSAQVASLGARAQWVGLSTNFGICYGGVSGEPASSNWSR